MTELFLIKKYLTIAWMELIIIILRKIVTVKLLIRLLIKSLLVKKIYLSIYPSIPVTPTWSIEHP
jgi:hypothetical protein